MSRSVLVKWRPYLLIVVILASASIVGTHLYRRTQPERIVGLANVLSRLEMAIAVDYPNDHNGAYPSNDWNQIRPYFTLDVPDWFWQSTVYNVPEPSASEAPLLLFVDLPGDPHGGSQVRFKNGESKSLTLDRLHELRPQLSPEAYQRTLKLLSGR